MRDETDVTAHPTEFELERYAQHGLAAADLLLVDDHLAVCLACRNRAFDFAHAAPRLASTVAAARHDLAEPAVIPFRARFRAHTWSRGVVYAAIAASIVVAMVLTRRSVPAAPPTSPLAASS